MDGWITIGTKLDTKSFDAQINRLESELKDVEYELENATKNKLTSVEIEEYTAKAEKLKNRIIDLKRQKEKLNETPTMDLEDIDKISDKIKKIIKNVGRWGLAVFSVRSAYMFVRQAVSTLSQYNEELATDLEYIRFALATTLQPVIETLVKWAYKLLSYINYIAKAWFNINLFANATTDAFNSADKNAKKLKKTLAGFDEISTVGSNEDENKLNIPSYDLSDSLNNTKVPAWLQWIADHKDLIKNVTTDLLILFGAVTISKVLKNIGTLFGVSGGMGLLGLSEILALIGTAVIVTVAIKGVKEAKRQLDELNDSFQANIDLSKGNKENLKKLGDQYQELYEKGKLTDDQTKKYTEALNLNIDASMRAIESLENQKTGIGELTGANDKLREQQELEMDTMLDAIEIYDKMYDQGSLNKQQQYEYKQYLEKTIGVLDNQGKSTDDLRKKYEKLTGTKYSTSVEIKTKLKTDEAETAFSKFIKRLKGLDLYLTSNGFVIGSSGRSSSGSSGRRHAKGGIINLPGPGVPLGNGHIGGEVNREGIVPLTDAQQMQLLGEAIGRYVNINATVPVYVGNRQIAKEIKRINTESDFSYNR